MLQTIPVRRFGEERDVAALVLFLASSASGYMTGTVLYLDGGAHMQSRAKL
jgi:NAD(P)-dependent dehydrogenase (short-subunit alcohol dehydrogenase family)